MVGCLVGSGCDPDRLRKYEERKVEVGEMLKGAGYDDSVIERITSHFSVIEDSDEKVINEANMEEKVQKGVIKKYQKKIKIEKKGYSITVHCYGFFGKFIQFVANEDDLKGSVSFKGNGALARYGSKILPANLEYYSRGDRSISAEKLERMLVNKSHQKQDRELIEELVKEGLETMFYSWR